MKKTLITIMLAAFAIMGCAAQDNVNKAFNNFTQEIGKGKNIYTMCKSIDYRDPESGETTGVCLVNEFRITSRDKHLITDLTQAMTKDSGKAYHSASGKAGSEGVTYAIAYGTGKNDFELVGVDNDMNFMIVCFKDKRQVDFRTSYAIEWKQDNDGCYIGKIYKIFGKKPDDYQSSKTRRIKSDNRNFTLNIDSIINVKSNTLEQFSQLEMLGDNTGNFYNLKVLSRGYDDNGTNDNTTWLTTFAMYCDKFKEKVKQKPSKGAVYATELLQMCKRADGVITDSEKKLCIKSLKECQKCSNDTFVTGLLDEAINWLNGKNRNS